MVSGHLQNQMVWLQLGGESLGQRAPKASSDLGISLSQDLSYPQLARVACSFLGRAKQAGCKWLKFCLFGVYWKQMMYNS